MRNALLQPPQVAVARWHLSTAPLFVLLPIERFCFFPTPVLDVAVGQGKIGAILMASSRKSIPGPIPGLKHAESATRGVPSMIVDEHKRLGRIWVVNAGLLPEDELLDGPCWSGSR